MATTDPDNIPYPDSSWTGGFKAAMALLAGHLQGMFNTRRAQSYRWANQTARVAQTGMQIDALGYQVDTDTTYRYDGSTWRLWNVALRTFIPSFSGTIGNGTAIGQYSVSSGIVRAVAVITLGTTTSIGTAQVSYPVPRQQTYGTREIGRVLVRDISANNYYSMSAVAGTDSARPWYTTSTQGIITPLGSSSSPFTMAQGDTLHYDFQYEVGATA